MSPETVDVEAPALETPEVKVTDAAAQAPAETLPVRRHRKVRSGFVVSAKMDKTAIVAIERLTQHPQFQKYIRVQKKVQAHDAGNECRVGDRVQIVETRPLSKNKCWRVQKFLARAAGGAS